jgi:hypothetical protein
MAQEVQKPEPNQQCIDWLTQLASMYQRATEAYAAGQNNKATYLNEAGEFLWYAAQEAQKPEPNQKIIQQNYEEAKDLKMKAEGLDQANTNSRKKR